MKERSSISLSDLLSQVRAVIEETFAATYWVVAEINSVNVSGGGHYWLELIEKGEQNEILAKSRASIWAYNRSIVEKFENTTSSRLSEGQEVLFNVKVEFSEEYGFKLTINDIDPSYTLGKMALLRAKTIERLWKDNPDKVRLTDDGELASYNQSLRLPLVVRKIAVISGKSSKGLQDFMDHIINNEHGFAFDVDFYESYVQGDVAPVTIREQLLKIFRSEESFDVVCIIRGGGAKTDFAAFDDYLLCQSVARFPIPVLTGIGHTSDQSILDMVSNRALKTPTAVADFIVANNLEVYRHIIDQESRLKEKAKLLLSDHRNLLHSRVNSFAISATSRVNSAKEIIQRANALLSNISIKLKSSFVAAMVELATSLRNGASRYFNRTQLELLSLENQLGSGSRKVIQAGWNEYLPLEESLSSNANLIIKQTKKEIGFAAQMIQAKDPVNVLKMGYALIKKGDQVIDTSINRKSGEELEVNTKDGNYNVLVK